MPEWVKNRVMYQIFPDRFANGSRANDPADRVAWGSKPTTTSMHGGDLDGIRQKIPYLKKLGVGGIYLNPIFESPSNHRYDITDYTKVDREFGGNKAFDKLLDATQKNDLKVVIDGVFNHTSNEHPWFKDVTDRGPKSEHINKYTVKKWPIETRKDDKGVLRSDDYASWWGYATLPELTTHTEPVRGALLTNPDSVVKTWTKDKRISGWRMDVADEVEPEFWQLARKTIKEANPDAYIAAENWHDASAMLKGDQFDGVMNYQYFRDPAVKFFAKKEMNADQFVSSLNNSYPQKAKEQSLNLLGSHDTPRFVTEANGDWYRQRPAAIFQMTYVGTPMVYYGDEIAMEGAADPDNRRAMPWNKPIQPGTPPDQMKNLYTKLITTRNQEPVLQNGDFNVLMTNNDRKLVAFRRAAEGQQRDAVVVLNNDVTGHNVTVPAQGFAPDGTSFTDAISGKRYTVKDGALSVHHLDGNYGAVLLRDPAAIAPRTPAVSPRKSAATKSAPPRHDYNITPDN